MGTGDRDYMTNSSEDQRRVESYEEDLLAQEYGNLVSPRKHTIQKITLCVAAILILLWSLACLLRS